MKIILSIALLAMLAFPFGWCPPALAADVVNGEKIFNAICAACHRGGGNVVMSNKTLQKEALEKYKMADIKKIKYQVKNGKNNMPAFGKRLDYKQIEDVATYVLKQAEHGW